MRSSKAFVAAAVLAASSLMGTWSAWATPACLSGMSIPGSGSVPDCTVGPLTFSNIQITPIVIGTAGVTLGTINPFHVGNEFGLELHYAAFANGMNSEGDIAWTYDVTGPGIIDTFLSLTGHTTGSGSIGVDEDLFNSSAHNFATLSLDGSGAQTITFAPVNFIHVNKDHFNLSGATGGTATSSILVNAFSVSVPEPASLALLGSALVGFGVMRRRRKRG